MEIGVEEFPAKYIKSTKEQLKSGIESLLKNNMYGFEKITVKSTPRRFAVLVENIEADTSSSFEKVKGPAKKIAIDENGEPSKALQGFMRSKKVTMDDVVFEELDGVEYVFATIKNETKPLNKVLEEGLADVIKNVSNPRSMKWGGKNIRFLRPIRWIVSLLNDQVLYFDIEGIKVANKTKGHRVLGQAEIVIDKIENYEKILADNYVILDEEERKNIIVKGLNRLSKSKGGNYIYDEDLMEEVVNINEYPTPFMGSFDKEYLKLPKEVIVTPMKDHQRYFPVEDDQKKLLPFFISVRNGDSKGMENVILGNEKVLVARLEDAKFFYEQDIEKPLSDNVEQLKTIGYHDGLGNLGQKTDRLVKLAGSISEDLNVPEDVKEYAKRAAYLSKADLVTKIVVEFTELQGTLGKIYALNSGENEIVAQAIENQYMPRFAGDEIPSSTAGIVLSLADKVDLIAGLHSIGIYVTGSQDPYGQRRAALGILNILIENKMDLDLKKVFQDALFNYAEDFGQNFEYDEVTNKILEFVKQRFRNKMIDEGHRYDIIDSVITQGSMDVYDMYEKILALESFFNKDDIDNTITRFVRIKNISKVTEELQVNRDALEETDLIIYQLLPSIEEIDSRGVRCARDLEKLDEISKVVDDYLDNTMINVEDEALKQARLSLIKNVSAKIENIFDPTIIVRS